MVIKAAEDSLRGDFPDPLNEAKGWGIFV